MVVMMVVVMMMVVVIARVIVGRHPPAAKPAIAIAHVPVSGMVMMVMMVVVIIEAVLNLLQTWPAGGCGVGGSQPFHGIGDRLQKLRITGCDGNS